MDAGHDPVLHGVPMDVIAAAFEVRFILNRVLPESGLPNSSFAFSCARFRNTTFAVTRRCPTAAEFGFDSFDTDRVVAVAFRKLHDQMPMIRQQTRRDELKRKGLLHLPDGAAEESAAVVGGKNWATVLRDEREEIGTAGDKPSAVIGHADFRRLGRAQRAPAGFNENLA